MILANAGMGTCMFLLRLPKYSELIYVSFERLSAANCFKYYGIDDECGCLLSKNDLASLKKLSFST